MQTASWILISIYMAIVVYLVIRGARRTQSLADYAKGSVSFAPWAVALSLAASMTSAATFIINPGFAAMYGLPAVLSFVVVLPLAALVSLIVLTKGFRKHGDQVAALTMAQWMGSRFGSEGFKRWFSVLSLLLITFIVLICVGISKVLAVSLGVNEIGVLAGVVVFIFGYMMFGGANSMVYTNTIQALLMLVVAIFLLGSGYEHFKEGVMGFVERLNAIDPALGKATNPESPLFRDYFEIIFCQVVIGVAIVCQPHIITKSLLLKSGKQVNQYLFIAIVVEILFFAVVCTGLYARLEFPDLTVAGEVMAMDGIIPQYVLAEFPVWMGLIVVLGLISAGISTLEGLIQSLSTTITADLLGDWKPVASLQSESQKILLNRVVIAVLAVVTFMLSLDQLLHPNLSVAIFAQNGVYAYFSAAFVPVLMGTFMKHTPKVAPIAASVTAIVVHFGVYYGEFTPYMRGQAIKNPAIASTWAILAALLVAGILYLVFRNASEKSEDSAQLHSSETEPLHTP
ncbi:sodium:solute symporter family transporter [Pontibacter sp. G13]|uniref:sodium/pantothenate symporter n=1 Tax=Pontibacter sp. G13 TaxID=3074898 RepID=UPI00288B9960|nr:sodium:solute symporter [Pontibacter sp. G13]WNJ20468.1 sodium:solute symporter [Pontibacter sp. G13]